MVERGSADAAREGAPEAPGTRARRKGIDALVRELSEHPRWRDRIVHWQRYPPRPGRERDLPAGIDPRLVEVLAARGMTQLWEHQARAIELALDRRDVLVATPTASGKTLCYTVPVLQSLLASEGRARALFLFPTKALTQDQTVGITGLVEALGERWHAYTYDGDTPPSVRRTLRDRGHLVLTNPWMLHQGILPNHAKWSELFQGLEWIVVDELHTLSGVFGSSVANVLRRLLRIARHYGASPRFLASSATLADPRGHAARIFGRDVEVVSEDASPSGERIFGIYDPPLLNPVAGLRANALEEARELAELVCSPARQTIFFCQRRTSVEVLTRYLKESASRMGLVPDEVRGYRGGYLPLLRREIEAGLKNGAVKVVVSTNALELGIDIGALDVAVLVGYPGSQASFWQRAGRVGRRGKPSLVVQIARSDPLDQYLALHPEWLFRAPRERIGLDPDNLVILSEQLKCAAFELSFRQGSDAALQDEPEYARSSAAVGILDYLAEESRLLLKRGGRWWWMADAYPAESVTLAGNEPDNVVVLEIDTERAIGEVDREASITTVHEGAIYQVEGETWRIERFDHSNRRAYARRVDTDYFTEAHAEAEVRVLRLERCAVRRRKVEGETFADESAPHEDYAIWRGEVHLTTVATLFKKVRFYTRENLGAGEIHLPPEELDTEAFVLTISDRTASEIGLVAGERASAWRAVGKLLRRVAPLFVRCSPEDLGLASHIRSPHFRRPALYLYDRVMGGVGLSEILFQEHRALLAAAREVLDRCECASGCPACSGPPDESGALGKELAAKLLAHLSRGAEPLESSVALEESLARTEKA
jgi:DEAD/DEAH box helicase domain-containing protein